MGRGLNTVPQSVSSEGMKVTNDTTKVSNQGRRSDLRD